MTWLDRLLGRGIDGTTASLARAQDLAAVGDHAGALKIWDKLARRGVARARNNLGACYAEGLGVERDSEVALRWITEAAGAGDPLAQRNRAALHLRGEGVTQDDAEAARLYRIAAENGDAPSQDMLSHMLLKGLGLDPNPVEARHWAERAAAAGVAGAMTRLGTIHGQARGTSRDPEKAATYWRRAADRGDADAQALLGQALLAGLGTPRDPVVALAWLIRAQNGGSLKAPLFLPAARAANDAEGVAEAERRALLPLAGHAGVIVGTAGHVDHGKTALVRALTGVETDRLPEEKRRGITIDLGFAYRRTGADASIGFVDVPGHEGFVGTMVAGATGIDCLLLVVAADDGIMPQTREHLAIADLLGLRHGLAVLSKADLADADRRRAVEADIRTALQGTGLADAPLLPVSTLTGEGLDALSAWLEAEAERHRFRDRAGRFRLAIDRSFVLAGAGTVVTGTVLSGAVVIGDRVVISPGGTPARVRSIHAQNRAAERGVAGQRCALNLAGIERAAASRGDMALAPTLHAPTQRLDVRLRVLPAEPKPLRVWLPVRLHHAAVDVAARLVPLSEDGVAPGETGYAQLVLDRPIAAAVGDRFVLRDTSSRRTIGGGTILDLRPPSRYRRSPERLAQLDALSEPDPDRAASRLLDLPPFALDLTGFLRDRALASDAVAVMVKRLGLTALEVDGGTTVLSAEHWQACEAALLQAVGSFHAENPDLQGLAAERLRLALEPRLPRPVFLAALARVVGAGKAVTEGSWVRLPGHEARLSPADEALWGRIAPHLSKDVERFRPPRVRDLAGLTGEPETDVRRICKLASRSGRVDQVAPDHFFARPTVAEMAEIVRDLSSQDPEGVFSAGQFRDRVDNGRKVAIQILEFFDRHGLTIRRGDLRRLNPHRADLFGETPP